MSTWFVESRFDANGNQQPDKRKLVIIVSSDKAFAESLRSHLAKDFDVLLAKDGGEAASKAMAVQLDLALVDLGAPMLGFAALGRMRGLNHPPVICALATPSAPDAHNQFSFDYVLARPSNGAEFVERVQFIVAKMDSAA